MSAILLERVLVRSFIAVCFLIGGMTAFGQIPGRDGAKTISGSETINTYTRLTNSPGIGATQLRVSSYAGFAAGDLILIYQAQGATLDWATNSASYGSVTNYNNAGRYEFHEIASLQSPNRINLTSGLQYAYTSGGAAQVVRIPQYTTLNVPAGTSIIPQAWNGQTGGIIAATVQYTATIDGSVNANGAGFRGGALSINNGAASTDFTDWRTTDVAAGAEKGESIGGSTATYDSYSGRYGRGAPANGGGGGNSHNGGGGGGANGGSAALWTGQGVMCSSCTGTVAWSLDPTYIALSGLSTSSGGGRGGYTYGAANMDALSIGPGNASWAGNNRRERGGLGGRPLSIDPCARVFFGGGGGAGNANNSSGGAGGNGGGIIFLYASTITGLGSITANGNNGANTSNTHNDAPGGGGGGGTILLNSSGSISGVGITAHGGNGGNQGITSAESEGPGGGGGGGFIATTTTALTPTATGGTQGSSTSSSVTEFPVNGATSGGDGQVSTNTTCFTSLPVELVSFSAHRFDGRVLLTWRTATESNNAGFEIERQSNGEPWHQIGFIPGYGTINTPQRYAFEDADPGALELRYRLRQVDRDGNKRYSSTVVLLRTDATAPVVLSHYPDPFTTGTVLTYSLPTESVVSLSVFDALGRVVARLATSEIQDAGQHTIPFESGDLAPGVYHGVLETPTGIRTTRMLRVR